jgi:hypothetical protein
MGMLTTAIGRAVRDFRVVDIVSAQAIMWRRKPLAPGTFDSIAPGRRHRTDAKASRPSSCPPQVAELQANDARRIAAALLVTTTEVATTHGAELASKRVTEYRDRFVSR